MASTNRQRQEREARERLQVYTARQEVHQHRTKRRMRDNLIAIAGVVVVVTLAAFTQIFYFSAGPGAPTAAPSSSAEPTATATDAAGSNVNAPDASLAEGRTWTGDLVFNDAITLGISLDGAAAPQAVASWVNDAQTGYLTGTVCHRLSVSDGFSFLQCGAEDLNGTSAADYGYGPVENAPADDLYPAGTIAMARASGDGYSNGHQFFIVTADTTIPADAAGGYTIVGTVTSGLDQLVAQVTSQGIDPATVGADGTGNPLVPTTITSLTLS